MKGEDSSDLGRATRQLVGLTTASFILVASLGFAAPLIAGEMFVGGAEATEGARSLLHVARFAYGITAFAAIVVPWRTARAVFTPAVKAVLVVAAAVAARTENARRAQQ